MVSPIPFSSYYGVRTDMQVYAKIVLIPVYNEEATISRLLDEVVSLADMMILINDGSTDTSRLKILNWSHPRIPLYLLDIERNRGKAYALKQGFHFLCALLKQGFVAPEDIVITLDADAQHDPCSIDAVCHLMVQKRYDVVLTQRDLSQYPFLKRLGNRLMSLIASVLAGCRYHDVECGYRFLRIRILPELMKYYTGYRYSSAQEIAVLVAQLGYHVYNGYPIAIRHYRSNPRMRDALINPSYAFLAWMRCQFRAEKLLAPLPWQQELPSLSSQAGQILVTGIQNQAQTCMIPVCKGSSSPVLPQVATSDPSVAKV